MTGAKKKNIHECSLYQADTSGLQRLAPNAGLGKRLLRRIRKLIIVDPGNFRCRTFFHNKSAILAEQRRHIKGPYYYMIHPFSTLNSFVEVTFFLFWMTKMFTDTVLGNIVQVGPVMNMINNYGFLMVQRMLIVTIFFVGYLDMETREVIIEPRRVMLKYLKSYFIFDVIGAETFTTLFSPLMVSEDKDVEYRSFRFASFAHVLCLYARLYTVLRYLDGIGTMLRLRSKVRKLINYTVKTFLYLHFFCSMLYAIPNIIYVRNYPENSWIVAANIKPSQNVSPHQIYRECLLLTVCYFFGASPGKYNIYQTNEQICLSFIALFGRLYTLYLLADALRMFGIVGVSESSYERKLAQLKEYMMSNNLPRILRGRMVKYYEYKLQKRYFNEVEILNSLSGHLRSEIFLFSARTLRHTSNLFKYLSSASIASLISMMRVETFAPGDIIFKPGQLHEHIYFISSGTVAVENMDGLELCHLEDGEIFGLMASVALQIAFSVVVIETTDVFVITVQEFQLFLQEYPDTLKYLEWLTKDRLAYYKRMEDTARKKIDTCLVELKKGRLLERRRKKKMVID